MMFSTHPEKFFPYTQIDVVIFPEGKEDNPNRWNVHLKARCQRSSRKQWIIFNLSSFRNK